MRLTIPILTMRIAAADNRRYNPKPFVLIQSLLAA